MLTCHFSNKLLFQKRASASKAIDSPGTNTARGCAGGAAAPCWRLLGLAERKPSPRRSIQQLQEERARVKWHWAAQRAAAQILTLCTACVCAEFPSVDAERTRIYFNTGGVTTAPNLFPNPQEPKQRGLQEKMILPDTEEDGGKNLLLLM